MPVPLNVTAVAVSAQLGGTERVLLDFAARAFEHDIALRVLTPREGPLFALLNQLGVPAEVVPGPDALLRGSQQPSRLASLVPALLALPRWARALSRHPFWTEADVLYTVAFKAHTAAVLRHDRPTVWHLHEFPPAVTGAAWRFLARRWPRALIANSRAVAEAWAGKRETGNGKGKTPSLHNTLPGEGRTFPLSRFPFPPLHVVPNGVDLDRFKPRPRTGWIHDRLAIPRNQRLIGMPAVFARWKGHELVLQAFEAVAAQFPDAHLVFVGGSIYDTVAERAFGEWLKARVRLSDIASDKSYLVRRASNADTPTHNIQRTHILPFQENIELVYPECDLVLHYSLRPEPFGRVILEAMACGVPVLAAAEGGPLEILETGKGETGKGKREAGTGDETPEGWLAVPREAGALAGTLRRALQAPRDVLQRKGEAGRRRAEERFSAREFARGVAEVLQTTALISH